LRKEQIQESLSPYVVLALLTSNNDNSWCMYIDSRTINKIIMGYKFQFPSWIYFRSIKYGKYLLRKLIYRVDTIIFEFSLRMSERQPSRQNKSYMSG
jgi:hypothetical protein